MPSAIVTGATGILGREIVFHLGDNPQQWPTVHALSRSKKESYPSNVVHNHIDLTASAEDMAKQLKDVDVEYVFYAAYLQKDTEQENWEVNGAMLKNFLQALSITGCEKTLKRVILTTGAKQYGGKNWDWVVTYPNDVIGVAKGNFMNLTTSLGLYAAVNKEMGNDLVFPGSETFYTRFDCFTYSRLHALKPSAPLKDPSICQLCYSPHHRRAWPERSREKKQGHVIGKSGIQYQSPTHSTDALAVEDRSHFDKMRGTLRANSASFDGSSLPEDSETQNAKGFSPAYKNEKRRESKTLKNVSWMSIASFISILSAVLITMIGVGIQKPIRQSTPSFPQATIATSFASAFLSTTNIVFAYAGHVSFFSFIAEFKDPREFPKALFLLQFMDISMYITVAIVVYRYAGDGVASPALGSTGPLLSRVAYGIALPTIIIAGVIYAHVAAKMLYVHLFRGTKMMSQRSWKSFGSWALIALILWVIAWIIAESIPSFNNLLSLISALFASWFTYGLSGVLWLYLNHGHWNQSNTKRFLTVVNVACFLIGGAICGCGLYASGLAIHNSPSSGSWTCADTSS